MGQYVREGPLVSQYVFKDKFPFGSSFLLNHVTSKNYLSDFLVYLCSIFALIVWIFSGNHF